MKFGHFDDANKEYVITSPKTPLPWINYLGCENFFSLVWNISLSQYLKLIKDNKHLCNNINNLFSNLFS